MLFMPPCYIIINWSYRLIVHLCDCNQSHTEKAHAGITMKWTINVHVHCSLHYCLYYRQEIYTAFYLINYANNMLHFNYLLFLRLIHFYNNNTESRSLLMTCYRKEVYFPRWPWFKICIHPYTHPVLCRIIACAL